jgi:hypothetical protein
MLDSRWALNVRLIITDKMKSDGDLYGVQHAVSVSVSVSVRVRVSVSVRFGGCES